MRVAHDATRASRQVTHGTPVETARSQLGAAASCRRAEALRKGTRTGSLDEPSRHHEGGPTVRQKSHTPIR
jgi:hypothetical protein